MLTATFFAFFGCSSGKRTALTVSDGENDYKLSYDLLRYFTMNYLNEKYSGKTAEDFESDGDLQNALYEDVISSVTKLATYSLLAEKYDVKLTSDEKKEVKNNLKEYKDAYESKDAFKKDLKDNYVTEDALEHIYMLEALWNKLYDHLTDEYTGIFKSDVETIDADIEAGNFFSAEYIAIYYTSENKSERTDDLERMLERVKNGEDMSSLKEENYSVYGEQLVYAHEPVFTYTELNEDYEEIVLSLEIGEYSDVMYVDNVAIIVHRLPLDEAYINNNYNEVIAKYLSRELFRYVEEYAAELEFEFKKKYKDIKLWEMK